MMDEITQQHHQLRIASDLLRVTAAASPALLSPTRWRALWTDALERFHGDLLQHFETEEDGGYMAETLARAPSKADLAGALHKQHDQMREMLEQLTIRAREESHEALSGAVLGFLDLLASHEASECELIQSVAWTDLGGGD